MKTNVNELIKTCDCLAHRCIKICDGYHGSAWLFDKLMRFFDAEPATEAVTIPIYINSPVMRFGEATIHRDGTMEMRTALEGVFR